MSTMRFKVMAAIAIGILLPTLETARRGLSYWFVNFTTMFEDYLAGAALVTCAFGALRGARWAPLSLLVVWSGVTFMMLLLLLLVCSVAFIQSLRTGEPHAVHSSSRP